MTTPTIEEYIEAIYIMESEGSPVISARVAERIGVSAPTMAGTLKRMVKQGYVVVDERKEITLTEKGRASAESLKRRHRLSERLLTDILGLDWSKAHNEACRLEHAISPEVEEKLSQMLHNPSTCPHGNPIPGVEQKVVEGIVPLNQVSDGEEVVVVRVSQSAENDPRLLDYLQRSQIIPGAHFKVVEVAPWAGTITLSRGDGTVSVGLQIASHIWVQIER